MKIRQETFGAFIICLTLCSATLFPQPYDLHTELKALESDDGETQALAIYHLGELGEAAAPAIPRLIGLLGDNNPGKYYFVFRITPSETEQVSIIYSDISEKDAKTIGASFLPLAITALKKIGKPAVPALIDILQSDNWLSRWRAADLLGEIADQRAYAALLRLLRDPEQSVRRSAIRSIVVLENEQTCADLIEYLADENRETRSATIEALGRLSDSAAIPSLLEQLNDPEQNVQFETVKALTKFTDPRIIDPLFEKQKNGNDYLRRRTAEFLGKINQPEVTRKLIAIVNDRAEKWIVRAGAAIGLGEHASIDSVEPLIAFLYQTEFDGYQRGDVAVALGKIALQLQQQNEEANRSTITRIVDTLIDSYIYEPHAYHQYLANALAPLNDKRTVPLFIQLLDDEDRITRGVAAAALREFGDERAVQPLISVLNDKYSSVQEDAIRALGRLGDSRAIGPLIEYLGPQQITNQYQAIDSLKKLTKQDFGTDTAKWREWYQATEK